jgi:hypothetical protein
MTLYRNYIIAFMLFIILSVPAILAVNLYIDQHYALAPEDVLLQQRLAKIRDIAYRETDTIFVGDSSCGNAIHEAQFSRLSGHKTENLCLSGSYGIIGSLNMLRRVREASPELKNVVLMHTPDIWHREFSYRGFFKTAYPWEVLSLSSMFNFGERVASRYLGKLFETYYSSSLMTDLFKNIIRGKNYWKKYTPDTDYIVQGNKRFSDGLKTLKPTARLGRKIIPEKVRAYYLFDRYCRDERLNCIFVHGPLHQTSAGNSGKTFRKLEEVLSATGQMKPVLTVFSYPNHMMGDSDDHVAPAFIKTSTRDYYQKLAPLLQ